MSKKKTNRDKRYVFDDDDGHTAKPLPPVEERAAANRKPADPPTATEILSAPNQRATCLAGLSKPPTPQGEEKHGRPNQ